MRYADKVGPRLRESDVPCVNHSFSHAILHSTFSFGQRNSEEGRVSRRLGRRRSVVREGCESLIMPRPSFEIPWLAASDSQSDLPAQGAEDEVHNEKCPGEDQGDEVDPGPRLAHRVVDLDVCNGKKQKKM